MAASKHVRTLTHFRNAVPLVWGSLRLTPIKLLVYQAFETDLDNFSEISTGEDSITTATNRNWYHIRSKTRPHCT